MERPAADVRCNSCHKEITSDHELMVVVFYGFRLAPHCRDCFANLHKRLWFQWYPRVPINHADVALRLGTVVGITYLAVMSWLTARFWDGVQEPKWATVGMALGFPALLLGIAWYLRWQSWMRFERPLLRKRPRPST